MNKTTKTTISAAKNETISTDNKTVLIAITGTIGSGKSLAGGIAAQSGALVIDTDYLSKELQADGTEAARLIKAAFGAEYYKGGFLNRKALGREVFQDKDKLRKLNGIMHPLIYNALVNAVGAARDEGYLLICALVPLLFEAGRQWIDIFDEIWLITAPEEECIKRIMARDKCTAGYAGLRLSAQMPLGEKLSAAESSGVPYVVIENDGGAAKLGRQVNKALKPYRKLLAEQSRRFPCGETQ